jgi:transketolase C-terminal domain/subunit
VYSLPWLKPICRDFLAPLHRFQKIVAVEEHVVEDGLAGLLRENLLSAVELRSVFVPEATAHHVGSQQHFWSLAGLSVHEVDKLGMHKAGVA